MSGNVDLVICFPVFVLWCSALLLGTVHVSQVNVVCPHAYNMSGSAVSEEREIKFGGMGLSN